MLFFHRLVIESAFQSLNIPHGFPTCLLLLQESYLVSFPPVSNGSFLPKPDAALRKMLCRVVASDVSGQLQVIFCWEGRGVGGGQTRHDDTIAAAVT